MMLDENIEKIILYYLIFEKEELKLAEEDFTTERNRQIYMAIKKLKKENKVINVISIKNEINPNSVEILTYLSDLAEFRYGTSLEYAYKTLRNMTKKKRILELVKRIETEILNEIDVDVYLYHHLFY